MPLSYFVGWCLIGVQQPSAVSGASTDTDGLGHNSTAFIPCTRTLLTAPGVFHIEILEEVRDKKGYQWRTVE
ncbi:MAG: hypothetical protein FWG15_08080 [Propionibacteriaceae bacterium]|nr:hypothetical protein [Propionibacteriaceae bacterium]